MNKENVLQKIDEKKMWVWGMGMESFDLDGEEKLKDLLQAGKSSRAQERERTPRCW